MKIEKRYVLPISVDDAYAAWVSSDTVVSPAKRMNVQPYVGGHFQLFFNETADSAAIEGLFLEVVQNERLRYSWQWDKDGEVTEVTVTFEPTDNGTIIAVVHDGFDSAEAVAMHETGWDSYIAGFEQHVRRQ